MILFNYIYYFLILTLKFGTLYIIDNSIYSKVPSCIRLFPLRPVCPILINKFFYSRSNSICFNVLFGKHSF
uniref:Uncharacterized protein n=1 Tax=Podoviridae sp. ct8Lf7 TaxID=2827723 RepID=A0A8S5S225_9CAUD|nr:MAG TPA: hypothetical protein [Podoviridae sp. ct8Lf7]